MGQPRDSAIGAYRIVRRVGAGGMGEVYLAYDERLGRLVALKRIRAEGPAGASAEARGRFRREARAAARMNHPYIVQVHDLLEDPDGGGDCIVMEYVEGRTIRDLLEEGALSPAVATRFAQQIAHGLAYAHQAGLVHRDLKAANVMVGQDGRIRILDFGLATAVEAAEPGLTVAGAVVGSVASMAPEQATGEEVDGRADLFSLGVLLYEMLAGRPPFQGKTAPAVIQKLIAEDPPPLDDSLVGEGLELPRPLVDLVTALLAKSPDDRPASAALVAQTLQGIAATLADDGPGERLSESWRPSGGDLHTAPTGWSPLPREGSQGTASVDNPPGVRRWHWSGVATVTVIAAVLAWALGSSWQRGDPEAGPLATASGLRVAVLSLQNVVPATAGAESLEPSEIGASLERGLLALKGITPVDAGQVGGLQGSPAEVALAAGADEVITASWVGGAQEDQVYLKRIQAADGAILWSERVPLPPRSESSLLAANALAAAMRRAFPEAASRAGFPDLESRPEDYADLLRIRRGIDEHRGSLAADLDSLEALGRRAPALVDAHVLAADSALNLYRSGKESSYLDRAQAALERGRRVAPDYPPLLRSEIRLATTQGEVERAEALFQRLEERVPGTSWIPEARARLLEEEGRVEEAAAVLREAVARRPTWRHLARLADLEGDLGRVDEARRRFEEALALVPESPWLQARLARLELLFGDLERAEVLYRELVATDPHRSDLTNLGLVHYLRRDFEAAASYLRQALEMAPGHLTVTLNLADAEAARGRQEEARLLYGEALASLEDLATAAPPSARDRTLEAQCLLGLGREEEALEKVRSALAASPEEAEVLFHAALVFARTGRPQAAVESATDALSRGLERRWLTVPGFDPLRSDPAFQALLDS